MCKLPTFGGPLLEESRKSRLATADPGKCICNGNTKVTVDLNENMIVFNTLEGKKLTAGKNFDKKIFVQI